MTSFLALVLETVDFTSLDGAKASSPKSGKEVINKFQGLTGDTAASAPVPLKAALDFRQNFHSFLNIDYKRATHIITHISQLRCLLWDKSLFIWKKKSSKKW